MSNPTLAPADLFTSRRTRRHRERLARLGCVLDPFTRRRLAEAGIRAGARCLEVGAGDGGLAGWMATQVAPGGQVIATDRDLTYLRPHPGVTCTEHDITSDPIEQLSGGGGFDIVHARLLISHLPGRLGVVRELAAALAPGGALVVEEFDGGWNRYVVQTPDTDAYRLFADYHEAMTGVLERCGKDLGWELSEAMHSAGLTDVDGQMWSRAWRGGQAGCLLLRDTIELEPLRDQLTEAGMCEQDLTRLGGMLCDPALTVWMHPLVSTIGRRPAPDAQPARGGRTTPQPDSAQSATQQRAASPEAGLAA